MHPFTYVYNASALGIGGVVQNRNGSTTVIPSLASVALAPTGGEGFNEMSAYDRDGVSFSNARSSVLGYDSGYRTFTTRSEVYITNLSLFGRVKAAILQMSVVSTREVLSNTAIATQSDPDNSRFTMQAMISGLTIDGVEVIPQYDLALSACSTYADFTSTIGGPHVNTYAQRLGIGATELRSVLGKVQPIRATFVSNLQHQPTAKFGAHNGFKLPVRNLGHVFFGEMVVKPGRRRVNLLRFDFDSTLKVLAANDEDVKTGLQARVAGGPEMEVAAAPPATSPYKGSATILSLDGNGAPSWP